MQPSKGVALLTVLFILALMGTVAAYMVDRQYLSIRRAANVHELEQARQMSLGSELWAEQVLEQDARTNKVDSAADKWAHLDASVTVEEGKLATQVVDAQARFNLNNLAAGRDKLWYPMFKRLLGALDLDEQLADAVVDWIDKDNNITGVGGAEDNTYLSKTPAYRAANRSLVEVSELNWIQGFSRKDVAALAPYVTVLPATDVPLNVNTCPPLLLQILTQPPISEAAVASLVEGRTEKGYQSVKEFLARPELAGKGGAIAKMVSVSSNFFAIDNRAKYGRISYNLRTLVRREQTTGRVTVIARRRSVP